MIHYPFDDDAGSIVVADKSGNGMDAILRGDSMPTWDLGHLRGGLRLEGSQSQYVQLPGGVLVGLDAMSVACWVRLDQAAAWNRLFDFSAGSNVWVYFSPTGWNFETGTVGTHFAISSGSLLDPEMQLTETVPVGTWHHVVVVLARPYLIYYLDGVEKARMTNMTLRPGDLGTTNQNWLGRSAFPTDPYLWGTLDEFRLYSGALTAAEVAQLAGQ